MARYGIPEMLTTDQGDQFTSDRFTSMLNTHGIKISMDGKRLLGRQYVCGATLA